MIRLILAASVVACLAVTGGAATAQDSTGNNEAELASVVREVESVLPPSWHVVESGLNELPKGWTGPATGLYVKVEDTGTRFFHPNGFYYRSFYRIWVMPPDWEGEMAETSYLVDSSPAFLLGLSETRLALYHTAGANVWSQGPEALCSALGLDYVGYNDLSRRVVDLEMEERLTDGAQKRETPSFVMNPYRILGLAGSGPGLYLEYIFGDGETPDASQLDTMTERLAGNVFERFPEVESLYLRRCTRDTFTDTIVSRD